MCVCVCVCVFVCVASVAPAHLPDIAACWHGHTSGVGAL